MFPRIGAAMLKNTRRITSRELLIDNNLCAAVPREQQEVDYLFEALCWLDLAPLAAPGPVPSVSDAQIRNARTPWPGSTEARARAVALLAEQRETLKRSSEHFLRQRILLAEYRDSLIHEAVTGKLDVSRVTEQQMDERLHAAAEDRLDEVAV